METTPEGRILQLFFFSEMNLMLPDTKYIRKTKGIIILIRKGQRLKA
jgi:hypothetical protein